MPNNKSHSTKSIPPSEQVALLFGRTVSLTQTRRYQFIMPEMVLYCLLEDEELQTLFRNKGLDPQEAITSVNKYFEGIERVPKGKQYNPIPSDAFQDLFDRVEQIGQVNKVHETLPSHFLLALSTLEGTIGQKILIHTSNGSAATLKKIVEEFDKICQERSNNKFVSGNSGNADEEPMEEPQNKYSNVMNEIEFNGDEQEFKYREAELLRAFVALFSVEHHHVVFVGDRGVGKSYMLYGLAQYCRNRFKRNSPFGQATFYDINVASLAAGSVFGDELEQALLKTVKDLEGRVGVLFIDNVADLMPQAPNDNTPDLMRVILGLIDCTNLHIVTTATFDQYKRLSSHSSIFDRYFTRIDLEEMSLEPEVKEIVTGYARHRSELSQVSWDDECVYNLVDSIKATGNIETLMPGAAIDAIDRIESLYLVASSLKKNYQIDVSEKVPCKIDSMEKIDKAFKHLGYAALESKNSTEERLKNLERDLLSKIFGQDEAVKSVAQTMLLAKAGLTDDTKPLAAYLFVGPTGVGKTELAKELANQLGVKLVRFDMSEYSEQHTVSKLVGSPAGYIGYDDGGLLTDAVRKSPNCVLLLDEIEKAHTAVFNILLQVLDYAQLTDNKGQKASFNNAVIIMTSNAGARFATGNGLGYGAKTQKSEVMSSELKRVFAPEFLNRLTKIVPFADMDKTMAERILDRKLSELAAMLMKRKKISFELTAEAREVLLREGFSTRYGAREMDRAIGSLLKPVLMNAILFEKVKQGVTLTITAASDVALMVKKD